MATTIENLQQFILATLAYGGASYSLNWGNVTKEHAWGISLAGLEEQHTVEAFRANAAAILQNYLLRNAAELSEEDNVLGTWVKDGIVHLDVTRLYYKDETTWDNAYYIGRKAGQVSIHDFETGENIDISPVRNVGGIPANIGTMNGGGGTINPAGIKSNNNQ